MSAAKKSAAKAAGKASKVEKFLAEVAADPARLGAFIKDPEKSLDDAKVKGANREKIKAALLHHIQQKLAAPPESHAVFI